MGHIQQPEAYGTQILGLVVQSSVEQQAMVIESLKQIPGVEIQGVNEGKIAITIDEYDSREPALRVIEHINQLAGVYNSNIVYHHFDSEPANQENTL